MTTPVRIILVLVLLTLCGALGFMLVEGWGFVDSLYMAVITLTTVGFKEVQELSMGGRVFTMVLIVVGLGVFMYGVVSLGEVVVHAQLGQWLGRSKMVATLKKMHNHFIVCGCGSFGRSLCTQLTQRGMPFVVIEADPEAASACAEKGWPIVLGDATDDATLAEAGIERANGIACTLASDAANLYVVMSARLLRKDLQILSRATTEKDAEKIRRAGADRVISMYATGAAKMAQLMANPRVEDFIEIVSTPGKELEMAEVVVAPSAAYAGKILQRSGLRDRGIVVVGIRRRSGELLVPPAADNVIEAGDTLIAFGKCEAIQGLLAPPAPG